MSAFCYKEAETYRKTFQYNLPHMEFVLSSSDELDTLPTNTADAVVSGERVGPCAPGSIAVVPSENAFYMMDPDGVWGGL
jgi:hypothetical protein